MAFEQVVQAERMANKDIIMYPAIEKKKCRKCKQANGYVTINGMCYDCFKQACLEDNERRAERKRKEEEKRERIKNKIEKG